MAIKVSIDVTSLDGNTLSVCDQHQLLNQLRDLEVNLPELTKLKFHLRPDLDYNFIIETSVVGKSIDQVVHVNTLNPLWSLISGAVNGAWRACEFTSLINVRRHIIEISQALPGFTDLVYQRSVV